MKVNYDIIIESYTKANQELLDDYAEIVTEAETVNTTSKAKDLNNSAQSVNKITDTTSDNNELSPSSKVKTNFLQRFKAIIKKIIDIVNNASVKIMNRIKLMFESDKAFQQTLHQRRAAVKPLMNFKAITYQYNDQYLETTVKGIQKLAIASIVQLSNFTGSSSDSKVKQIIESDQSSVSSVLLSFFTKEKSSGIETQSFIREMIDLYRGPKKEKMWSQSSIPQLMAVAKSSSDLSNRCNDIIGQCKNSVNTLKALESKARLQNTSEGIANISRRLTKANSIYNTLLAVSRMYFELKLEEALSARLLLKKFYQF